MRLSLTYTSGYKKRMWKKLEFKAPLEPHNAVKRAPGDAAKNDWQEFVQTFDFLELIREWRTIVGEMLASQSVPMRLKNRTLFILTRHPAFSEQLSYLSVELIQKITKRFPVLGPQMERLAFESNESFFIDRAKKVAPKPLPPSPHPFDPAVRKARAEAEKIFIDVEDPTERERWISLYLQTSQTE